MVLSGQWALNVPRAAEPNPAAVLLAFTLPEYVAADSGYDI
ncbi:hypothetical protein JOE57_000799 [Microlunatus panaciterrae]|uniref:Uncharacterized protein n=1 Tax=Microlunatus panaciterrae TaxID=400768 RepID=A0ABS2RFU5_9ACTN|nr:hypothetical protein [Microlunatus panaciterrae]